MPSIKFVAYTQTGQESSAGTLINHVIAPIDVSAIPADTQALFPNDLVGQMTYHAVEPQHLDRILGIFDTYVEATQALASVHYWRRSRTAARWVVANLDTGTILTQPCTRAQAETMLRALPQLDLGGPTYALLTLPPEELG